MATLIELNEDGGGGLKKIKKPVMSLLSVLPLRVHYKNKEGDEEEDHEKSANFTAETHASHIRDVMKRFYNIDMDESDWCTNQTSDNVSSNLKLARFLGINSICCNNHLLSNEVKLRLMGGSSSLRRVDLPIHMVIC